MLDDCFFVPKAPLTGLHPKACLFWKRSPHLWYSLVSHTYEDRSAPERSPGLLPACFSLLSRKTCQFLLKTPPSVSASCPNRSFPNSIGVFPVSVKKSKLLILLLHMERPHPPLRFHIPDRYPDIRNPTDPHPPHKPVYIPVFLLLPAAGTAHA